MAKQPVLAAGLGQDNKPTLSRVRHILGLAPTQRNCPFWLAGVITVLFLAALVIPTTLALTSRADEPADIQEKKAQKELSKFTRTLPNGVTVELVGLFCGVEEDKRVWWQADGMELPKDSFQGYDERIKPMIWNDIPERRLLYGYVFTCFPSKDVELITDVSEGTKWHTGFADAQRTAHVGYVYSGTIEEQEAPPDVGGIKIAAAAGEGEQFESKVYSGNVEDTHILENGTNVIVSGPREYHGFDEKMVDVIVTASDIHVAVSYELKSGVVRSAKRDSVMGGPSIVSFYGTQRPLHQHSFRVFDPWDQITKFIVDYRKYELVTFKNVSLRPGHKSAVQVEGENRIEELDIETLLAKVRKALQPTDNMRVSWQYETVEPFGAGTTKSPHTVREYIATISGFKSRLEYLQKTYSSKASEDPYDIHRVTYVFDGKQCRNLEERIKGGKTTPLGWEKPENVTVVLLYQELFACILPLHNKDKLNEYKLNLVDSPSPGIYVIKVIGPEDGTPYQITIDGSRGFNIINTQWFGPKNTKTLEDTTVLRQYDDGIWYPAERTRTRYYPNGTHKLEHIEKFSKLELDVKVPEETFKLEFPPGTKT
jgi:hypothetical protein